MSHGKNTVARLNRLIQLGFRAAVAILCFQALTSFGSAQTVTTPVLSPTSGISPVQFTVSVTDSTAGAGLYYTLDGTTPTTSSTLVTGNAVVISKSETLSVKGFKTGYTSSAVASATYEITGEIAGGYSHSVVLKSDGSVWAWGLNSDGQVGDDSTTQRNSPVQIRNSSGTVMTGFVAVSAGAYHSMALDTSGHVWCWGLNSSGQLGTGVTGLKDYPVEVLKSTTGHAALSNIVAISAGAYHSMALDSSGNVWTWGANSDGQMGNGGTTSSSYAVELTGITGSGNRFCPGRAPRGRVRRPSSPSLRYNRSQTETELSPTPSSRLITSRLMPSSRCSFTALSRSSYG